MFPTLFATVALLLSSVTASTADHLAGGSHLTSRAPSNILPRSSSANNAGIRLINPSSAAINLDLILGIFAPQRCGAGQVVGVDLGLNLLGIINICVCVEVFGVRLHPMKKFYDATLT